MYRKKPEKRARITESHCSGTEKNNVEAAPKTGAAASTMSHLKARFLLVESPVVAFFNMRLTVLMPSEKSWTRTAMTGWPRC